MTHVSTGDALRAAIRARTPLGHKAQEVISRGELVDDDLVTDLLESIIAPKRKDTDSFLFDGYPRTVEQVHRLDSLCEKLNLSPPAVINLHVPEETILLRLTGRRICGHCGATFNAYFRPTRVAGVCDVCSGPLTRRVDDSPETTRERFRVYQDQSTPVIDTYAERGVLYTIDATQGADEVFKKITRIIEEHY